MLWRDAAGDPHQRELAHHLRHPVAKILGWAEILHDDHTMPDTQAQQLQVIYQSAQDLQRQLDQAACPL
ncbi:histidine kinase dimerization/phospho-acceptor domain-containing protein [Actinoplanes oblitus]|uniref:histidine kinase n=1 Tax=Actinoplanes oblitus TaxID=3040509 RepID=A0ABY8W9I7_9ACTN|nr:histidine kinase dimerization/phospho-acceptor domain-containing protein [Actinoplanes oblitus]WIM94534.1 histidine kinase dimerization/phospho-acceptor domain-containing protein [Actinoplanes oblitus]